MSNDSKNSFKQIDVNIANLSKNSKRKFQRYGKTPTTTKSSQTVYKKDSKKLTKTEYLALGLQVQSGSQERLWKKGEQIVQRTHFSRMR